MPKEKSPARKLAEEQGEVTYSTGKPCLKGHISNRYTKGGRCISCVSESKGRQPDSRQRSRKNIVLAETKIVRGLLCNTCNQGIGLLLHSPELLIKAAAYCGGIC